MYPVILLVMGTLAMAHILSFTDIKDKVNKSYGGIGTSIVNSGEFVGSSLMSILIVSTLNKAIQYSLIH